MTYPAPYYPAPKKRRVWPWVVGALVFLLVVGSCAAALGGNEETPRTTNLGAPVVPSTPETTPEAPSGPKTSFGDGTWVVGEDIEPGTYKTAGAREGMFEYCQITTHSDTEADSDKTLDWKNGNANEPIRVKISGKVKSVNATGCEDFVKVS